MLRLIALLAALVFAAPAAHADTETVRNRFISVLQEDGYNEIRISRTLLGRMRFVGSRSDARREIVVNPNSGVVLRDYVRFLRNSSAGSNPRDDDDDDDDDDHDDDEDDDDHDDDEEDDDRDDEDHDRDDDDEDNSGSGSDDDEDDSDNSGSGSSNSGSGSSNSGSGSDDDD